MPSRFEKHSACPGCGIFTNLESLPARHRRQRGAPLQHRLRHGGDHRLPADLLQGVRTSTTSSTTSRPPRRAWWRCTIASAPKGMIPDEEITFICVSGDGGDDIGMDQLIGAALRNDPIIFLEYDNKGYMNTGGQLCYTGIFGQRNSNAYVGAVPDRQDRPSTRISSRSCAAPTPRTCSRPRRATRAT